MKRMKFSCFITLEAFSEKQKVALLLPYFFFIPVRVYFEVQVYIT